MNNIETGSKVKVRKSDNCVRWYTLYCPDEVDGIAIEDLDFVVEGEDAEDYLLSHGTGKYSNVFYFPRETVFLAKYSEHIEETKQEPEGHVHAELMLEYAKDALVSKEPWKDWEFADGLHNYEWVACDANPAWAEDTRYRRKPKTILINGYEVPEPIRNLPALGKSGVSETVWIPSLSEYPSFALGVGNSYTRVFFDRGLCHLTKEAADLHAKALLSFTTTL